MLHIGTPWAAPGPFLSLRLEGRLCNPIPVSKQADRRTAFGCNVRRTARRSEQGKGERAIASSSPAVHGIRTMIEIAEMDGSIDRLQETRSQFTD